MAKVKSELLAGVAASMQDRGNIRGEYPAPTAPGKSSLERQSDGRRRHDSACVIRVDRIVADPNQPRTEFDSDALARLAESLKTRGQLQPIRVRWDDQVDRYVIVVGERRWRAAGLAGLETLACVVVTGVATSEDLLEDQLVENALREDLKPVEQARAFRSLMVSRGLSQRQLAERLQIGQGSVSKALALLGLPVEVQASVDAGEIGPDTAYQLSRVADRVEQVELARETAKGAVRRDEVKARVRSPQKKSMVRKITARTFRVGGFKITAENRRGIDAEALAAVLEDAARQVRAEALQPAESDAA
jgi:ParB family transcriptional regulator, chromosome partitioning protein